MRKRKRRIPDDLLEPQGPGPWFAFMLVNVGQKASVKKQTEIRCHTHVQLIQELKNLNSAGDWRVLMCMGPFDDWDKAIAFTSLWSNKTRGQMPRIAKGLYLANKFRSEGYTVYCTEQTKEELVEVLRKRKEWLDIEDGNFVPPATLNPNQVEVSYATEYLQESSRLASAPPAPKRFKKVLTAM